MGENDYRVRKKSSILCKFLNYSRQRKYLLVVIIGKFGDIISFKKFKIFHTKQKLESN